MAFARYRLVDFTDLIEVYSGPSVRYVFYRITPAFFISKQTPNPNQNELQRPCLKVRFLSCHGLRGSKSHAPIPQHAMHFRNSHHCPEDANQHPLPNVNHTACLFHTDRQWWRAMQRGSSANWNFHELQQLASFLWLTYVICSS